MKVSAEMVLYKYLTPARLDVLEHRRIRFTQPAAFNDPFEFKPYIAASQEHLREYVEQNFDETLRRALGSVPQELALYPRLTCKENLESFGRYHGLAGSALQQKLTCMFVQQGSLLTGIGVARGLVAAAVSMRLLSSQLFNVKPVDPVTYAAASVGLA